jgi:hypothetical protein
MALDTSTPPQTEEIQLWMVSVEGSGSRLYVEHCVAATLLFSFMALLGLVTPSSKSLVSS